jgi:predicted O-methyltransferase YrrM
VFLDAEKHDYVRLFELFFPLTAAGGLIVADNVISHKNELQGYIHMVHEHQDLISVLVPIGTGELLSHKPSKA